MFENRLPKMHGFDQTCTDETTTRVRQRKHKNIPLAKHHNLGPIRLIVGCAISSARESF